MSVEVFKEFRCEAVVNIPGSPYLQALYSTEVRVSIHGQTAPDGAIDALDYFMKRVNAVRPEGSFVASVSVRDEANLDVSWDKANAISVRPGEER